MRKPRELKDGALYHVTARANRKEMILDDQRMKDLFLGVLKRAKAKYRFRVENFCVMGNHIHLMIRPEQRESLSRIMQWILSVFAMTYNRKMGYSGHVWGCRFFSKILESFLQYKRVFEYIDQNPVKSKQVENAKDWWYGGLWQDRHGFRGIIDGVREYVEMTFPEHEVLLLDCE